MLVLTRREGEKLRVGDDVTLTIVYLSRRHVRIAIDAPDHVNIWRDELGQWNPAKRPRNAIEAAKRAGDTGSDNVFDDEDCLPPSVSCDAPAGSPERIAELARRVEAGESLWCERDRDRRLKNSTDIARWVADDLAATRDTRRTFSLKYDAVFTLPGRLVSVDRVGIVGHAIMLRDGETAAWFSAEEVLEPLTSPVWRRIHAVINGNTEYGREVRS